MKNIEKQLESWERVNILRLCDILLDIKTELDLSTSEVVQIQYGPPVTRFEELRNRADFNLTSPNQESKEAILQQLIQWGMVKGFFSVGGRFYPKFRINLDRESFKKLFQQLQAKYPELMTDKAGVKEKPLRKMSGRCIKKIVCVRGKSETRDMELVVNEDYLHPVSCSLEDEVWKLLLRLSEGEQINYNKPEHKKHIDYLNSSSENRIYTQTGLLSTKVLGINQGIISPQVDLSVIDMATLKRRQNRVKGT